MLNLWLNIVLLQPGASKEDECVSWPNKTLIDHGEVKFI